MGRPAKEERNQLAWDLYQQGKSYDEIFEMLAQKGYNDVEKSNIKVLIYRLKEKYQKNLNKKINIKINKNLNKYLNKDLNKKRNIKMSTFQLYEDQTRFIKSYAAERGYKVSEFLRKLLDKKIKELKEEK